MRISDWSSDVCSSDLFLLRHLQLARLGVARKNPAGCAHLDHLGAIFALAADLITKLVGRVADALFLAVLLFEARRQVGAVAMPAGRAERVARGHDARPGRIARVNRLLPPDVVAVARPDVAHGSETRAAPVVGIFQRDRKSCGYGKSVSVRVESRGRR